MGIDFDSIPVVTPESEDYSEGSLQLVTSVPLWLLRGILLPGGTRQEPRPKITKWHEIEANPRCAVCDFNVPFTERAVVNGITYHMDCWQRKNKAAQSRIISPEEFRASFVDTSGIRLGDEDEDKNGEMPGNLGDAEYHLWVGTRLPESDFAMCRACKFITHGSHIRALHKMDATRYIGGKPCWNIISQICKIAQMKNRCMVCKTPCAKARWGVHLCGWRCANEWKFNQEVHWLDFAINLLHIQKEAHDAKPIFD